MDNTERYFSQEDEDRLRKLEGLLLSAYESFELDAQMPSDLRKWKEEYDEEQKYKDEFFSPVVYIIGLVCPYCGQQTEHRKSSVERGRFMCGNLDCQKVFKKS